MPKSFAPRYGSDRQEGNSVVRLGSQSGQACCGAAVHVDGLYRNSTVAGGSRHFTRGCVILAQKSTSQNVSLNHEESYHFKTRRKLLGKLAWAFSRF